jgi:UDP-GlcNAc:undecaprenyl-phosphate GlcNAc-1-phosphate transferase
MGDADSMFIGLSVIWLLTIGTQGESASFRPVSALWICAITLMVMLAIVMRRYRECKFSFKPNRDHLHHILQLAGFCSRQTLVIISIASVIMSLLGLLSEYFQGPESIVLALFVLMFILYNKYVRHFSWKYNE